MPSIIDEDSLVGGEAREHHQRINQALDDLVVTRERPIRTHDQRHRLALIEVIAGQKFR